MDSLVPDLEAAIQASESVAEEEEANNTAVDNEGRKSVVSAPVLEEDEKTEPRHPEPAEGRVRSRPTWLNTDQEEALKKLCNDLRMKKFKSVVLVTGAGVSTAAGLSLPFPILLPISIPPISPPERRRTLHIRLEQDTFVAVRKS